MPIGSDPLVPLVIALKQGADLLLPTNWVSDVDGIDFANCIARLDITDSTGTWSLLTTTIGPNGGLYLGSVATGDAGAINFTFTKASTQVLEQQRTPFDLYVTWSDGTVWCVYTGTILLLQGSPF